MERSANQHYHGEEIVAVKIRGSIFSLRPFWRRTALTCFIALAVDGGVLAGQQPNSQAVVAIPGSQASAAPAQEAGDAPGVDRRRQIADQSEMLLKLANSLKAAVDKSTGDTLSITVIRNAGEIEHLAHSLKQVRNPAQEAH
jgi:hypothetical protein